MLQYVRIGQQQIKFLILIFIALGCCSNPTVEQSVWIKVDDGLHYSEFSVPIESGAGNSKILIVKVDPGLYDCVLLSTSEQTGGQAQNVIEWAEKYGLIIAINAGMFQRDFKTNVGYMKNYNHFNNPRIHKNYASAFAFNPRNPELPRVRIFDTDTDNPTSWSHPISRQFLADLDLF